MRFFETFFGFSILDIFKNVHFSKPKKTFGKICENPTCEHNALNLFLSLKKML